MSERWRDRVVFGRPVKIEKFMLNHQMEKVDDEDLALAMKEVRDGFTPSYFLRGDNYHKLYDPWTSFSGVYGKFDARHHSQYRWLKVTEQSYNAYLRFLEHKHTSDLTQAENSIYG